MSKLVHPGLRPYGKLRYLTYNCLLLQFAAYSLCLASHFVPRLRKFRDFFLTTLALPVSALVFIIFWGVWHFIGREQIFPVALEQFYPNWLNHITHTIILPINLFELYLVRHEYSASSKSLPVLLGYMLTYATFLVYMKLQSGVFVYGFLNQLDFKGVTIVLASAAVIVSGFFFFGKALTKLFHGTTSSKSSKLARHQGKKSN